MSVVSSLETRMLTEHRSLTEEIRSTYHKNQWKVSDSSTLFLQIEAQFGQRIAEEVCVPYNIHEGACIAAMMSLCRSQADG